MVAAVVGAAVGGAGRRGEGGICGRGVDAQCCRGPSI